MKEIYKDIALQAGGSHYPEVGGELLEKFADLLVKKCIETVEETPTHCASTSYDLDTVKCTIVKAVETLREKFKV